jgi:uncharacterized membrane protein
MVFVLVHYVGPCSQTGGTYRVCLVIWSIWLQWSMQQLPSICFFYRCRPLPVSWMETQSWFLASDVHVIKL